MTLLGETTIPSILAGLHYLNSGNDLLCLVDHSFIVTKPGKPMSVRLPAPPGPLTFRIMPRVELHLFNRVFERPLAKQVLNDTTVAVSAEGFRVRWHPRFNKTANFVHQPASDHLVGTPVDPFIEHTPRRVQYEEMQTLCLRRWLFRRTFLPYSQGRAGGKVDFQRPDNTGPVA